MAFKNADKEPLKPLTIELYKLTMIGIGIGYFISLIGFIVEKVKQRLKK